MATPRSEARISVDLWTDPDFRALPPMTQRLYVFLLSQRNMLPCGLLPITIKRWASAAPGLTADEIQEDVGRLAAARFIVCDWDTEELIIRTLLRNDGLFKNHRMLPTVIKSVAAIESSVLRTALLTEVRRLPADRVGEQHRATCVQMWEDLAVELGSRGGQEAPPVEGRPPAVEPEKPQVEGGAHGGADPHEDGGPDGGLTRAGARGPLSLAPSPLPLVPTTSAPARPKRRTPAPDRFELTPELREWGRQNAPLIKDPVAETELFLDWHRGKGSLQKDWVSTWRAWMRKAQAMAAERQTTRPSVRAGHVRFDASAQDYDNPQI